MKQASSTHYAVPFPFLTALCAIAGFIGSATPASAAETHGNVTVTSDYVWRGSTQTQGNPALQAGLKFTGRSGVYAAVWGSNVKFAPETHANTELDLSLGYGRALSDNWSIDANLLRYHYPAARGGLDWTELNSTLTYKNTYWAAAGYSNEALGTDARGLYTQVGAKFPVNEKLRIEAGAAHYFLDGAAAPGNGYTHGWLGAAWTVNRSLEARVTLHATDENARTMFCGDMAGTRIEAALQASF